MDAKRLEWSRSTVRFKPALYLLRSLMGSVNIVLSRCPSRLAYLRHRTPLPMLQYALDKPLSGVAFGDVYHCSNAWVDQETIVSRMKDAHFTFRKNVTNPRCDSCLWLKTKPVAIPELQFLRSSLEINKTATTGVRERQFKYSPPSR